MDTALLEGADDGEESDSASYDTDDSIFDSRTPGAGAITYTEADVHLARAKQEQLAIQQDHQQRRRLHAALYGADLHLSERRSEGMLAGGEADDTRSLLQVRS